jgi:hypothetical protein
MEIDMNAFVGTLNPNPYSSEPFIFSEHQKEIQRQVRTVQHAESLRILVLNFLKDAPQDCWSSKEARRLLAIIDNG